MNLQLLSIKLASILLDAYVHYNVADELESSGKETIACFVALIGFIIVVFIIMAPFVAIYDWWKTASKETKKTTLIIVSVIAVITLIAFIKPELFAIPAFMIGGLIIFNLPFGLVSLCKWLLEKVFVTKLSKWIFCIVLGLFVVGLAVLFIPRYLWEIIAGGVMAVGVIIVAVFVFTFVFALLPP